MKKKKQSKSDTLFKKFLGLCKKSGAFPILPINKVNLKDGLLILQEILKLRNKYNETKNFIYVIEAFFLAYKSKFDTPYWVTSFLYEAFYKFHCSEGTLDLLSLLGLKAKQKRGSPYKTLVEKERNDDLIFDIQILKNVYKVPLGKAVEIVYEKQFINKQRRESLCLSSLSKDTILTYYNNSPFARKIRNDKDLMKNFIGNGDIDKFNYFIKEYANCAIRASKNPHSEVSPNDIEKILSPLIKLL